MHNLLGEIDWPSHGVSGNDAHRKRYEELKL